MNVISKKTDNNIAALFKAISVNQDGFSAYLEQLYNIESQLSWRIAHYVLKVLEGNFFTRWYYKRKLNLYQNKLSEFNNFINKFNSKL